MPIFHLGQYTRHDCRCWYSPWGEHIIDKHTIDELEAEYRKSQAEHDRAQQPRPERNGHGNYTAPTGKRGRFQTPRESETRRGE